MPRPKPAAETPFSDELPPEAGGTVEELPEPENKGAPNERTLVVHTLRGMLADGVVHFETPEGENVVRRLLAMVEQDHPVYLLAAAFPDGAVENLYESEASVDLTDPEVLAAAEQLAGAQHELNSWEIEAGEVKARLNAKGASIRARVAMYTEMVSSRRITRAVPHAKILLPRDGEVLQVRYDGGVVRVVSRRAMTGEERQNVLPFPSAR